MFLMFSLLLGLKIVRLLKVFCGRGDKLYHRITHLASLKKIGHYLSLTVYKFLFVIQG